MKSLKKTGVIAAGLLVASTATADKTRTEFAKYKPGQAILFGDQEYTGSSGSFHHEINPKGTTSFDFSTGTSIALRNNYRAFSDYLEKPKGGFNPRVTTIGLSLEYSRFVFSDLVGFNGSEERKDGLGKGNAIGVFPSVVFAGSLGSLPIELETYMSFQYLKYALEVSTATQKETVSANGFYTGRTGIELRFPTLLSSNPPFFRLERLGMGASGTFPNQFMYITSSINYSGSETHLVRTTLTPYHNSFAGKSELGLETHLLNIQQVTDWGAVSTFPGIRTEYNTKNKTTRTEAFSQVNLEIQARYCLALRGGWSGIVAGDETNKAPSTPFVSVSFTINTNR